MEKCEELKWGPAVASAMETKPDTGGAGERVVGSPAAQASRRGSVAEDSVGILKNPQNRYMKVTKRENNLLVLS